MFDTSTPHAVNAEPSCTWMLMRKKDARLLFCLRRQGRRLGHTQCPHTLKAGRPRNTTEDMRGQLKVLRVKQSRSCGFGVAKPIFNQCSTWPGGNGWVRLGWCRLDGLLRGSLLSKATQAGLLIGAEKAHRGRERFPIGHISQST